MRRLVLTLLGCLALASANAFASNFDYQLKATQLTPAVYVVGGANEELTFKNGGNILNTGFIIGTDGVILIDAGPSRLYGEQLRKLVSSITPLPVKQILITHHHPDHFFGLQAFETAKKSALKQTIIDLQTFAEGFSDNMYRLIGNAMLGTEIVLPNDEVQAGDIEIAGRQLVLYSLSGHTKSDLAVLDRKSGVLFTGDLTFYGRAPTTPHANIDGWLASLDTLRGIEFSHVVPGHGPVATDDSPMQETADYIKWLQDHLQKSVAAGLSMAEAIHQPLAARFLPLSVIHNEYQRSVVHLYGDLEEQLLPIQ